MYELLDSKYGEPVWPLVQLRDGDVAHHGAWLRFSALKVLQTRCPPTQPGATDSAARKAPRGGIDQLLGWDERWRRSFLGGSAAAPVAARASVSSDEPTATQATWPPAALPGLTTLSAMSSGDFDELLAVADSVWKTGKLHGRGTFLDYVSAGPAVADCSLIELWQRNAGLAATYAAAHMYLDLRAVAKASAAASTQAAGVQSSAAEHAIKDESSASTEIAANGLDVADSIPTRTGDDAGGSAVHGGATATASHGCLAAASGEVAALGAPASSWASAQAAVRNDVSTMEAAGATAATSASAEQSATATQQPNSRPAASAKPVPSLSKLPTDDAVALRSFVPLLPLLAMAFAKQVRELFHHAERVRATTVDTPVYWHDWFAKAVPVATWSRFFLRDSPLDAVIVAASRRARQRDYHSRKTWREHILAQLAELKSTGVQTLCDNLVAREERLRKQYEKLLNRKAFKDADAARQRTAIWDFVAAEVLRQLTEVQHAATEEKFERAWKSAATLLKHNSCNDLIKYMEKYWLSKQHRGKFAIRLLHDCTRHDAAVMAQALSVAAPPRPRLFRSCSFGPFCATASAHRRLFHKCSALG